jgi:aminoglycoside phosphotransferase (APT) family kinase protein
MAAHPELVPALVPDGPPRIVRLVHADGGMANETLLLELAGGDVAVPGVVVRLPPLEATFPTYDLAPQALVQNAVAAAGVPAPSPAVVVTEPEWIGTPFLVMPRVSGDIPGAAPLFDPYVADAGAALQRRMHDELTGTVARIHGVDWVAAGLGAVLPPPGVRDALDRWVAYVEWSSEGDPLPALAAALDWCGRHLPPERDPVLLWGDVRLGNLVFGPERRVTAVLDWDLSSLGPRGMDLGWHCGLEFMMERLFGRRVTGFPDRHETVAHYERVSGQPVHDLDWHEVFALVRALAINDRHQRITGDRRRADNPMGRILLERMEAADSV